jgi:hypothetical protein
VAGGEGEAAQSDGEKVATIEAQVFMITLQANKLDELKKWQAERAKYPAASKQPEKK